MKRLLNWIIGFFFFLSAIYSLGEAAQSQGWAMSYNIVKQGKCD
ncbi:hypothetical protein [Halobacillus amylolyticus]|nr:hypothetical protein [Halobacillus amylolyticus]